MVCPPASASLAVAVMPTATPMAAFSATVLVSPLVSVGPTTGLSFTLVMLSTTALLPLRPPLSVSTTLKL